MPLSSGGGERSFRRLRFFFLFFFLTPSGEEWSCGPPARAGPGVLERIDRWAVGSVGCGCGRESWFPGIVGAGAGDAAAAATGVGRDPLLLFLLGVSLLALVPFDGTGLSLEP